MKTENLTKEQEYKVLKLIEQAYRKGIFDCRDCNQSNSAINAHLIASQVTAFELFEQFSLYKDHLTTASGSVAATKEEPKSECPKCGSHNIVMFTSDDDLCQSCEHTFPGVLGGKLKTAAPKEEPKEQSTGKWTIAKMFNKESLMFDNCISAVTLEEIADKLNELSSLRDQLRQRDELIKKVHQLMTVNVPSVQSAKYSEWIEVRSEFDSLIKKSQKL